MAFASGELEGKSQTAEREDWRTQAVDHRSLAAFQETRALAVLAYCTRLCAPQRIREAVDAAFSSLGEAPEGEGQAELDTRLRSAARRAAARCGQPATLEGDPPLSQERADPESDGSCELVPRLLVGRAESTLPASEARLLESHMASCGLCRERAKRFEEAERAYATLLPHDPLRAAQATPPVAPRPSIRPPLAAPETPPPAASSRAETEPPGELAPPLSRTSLRGGLELLLAALRNVLSRRPIRLGTKARRRLSIALLVVGVLLIVEAALTVFWEEPFTAYLASLSQDALRGQLAHLDRAQRGLAASQEQSLAGIGDPNQRTDARLAVFARRLDTQVGRGQALGRLKVPRIGIDFVFVQGTDTTSLRKGPGHYWHETPLPGEPGTVGIAGHRTTYLAPFRDIDSLRRGDRITITMPYGRFVYAVEGHRIVPAGKTDAFRDAGYQRLVLSACHPLYSASHRILVFARLVSRQPLGLAAGAPPAQASAAVRRRTQAQLTALGNRQLSLGMRGSDVRELQHLLGVPETGYFGYQTQSAVESFESGHSLPVDGLAGDALKRLLARRSHPPLLPPTPPSVAPAPPPSTGGGSSRHSQPGH